MSQLGQTRSFGDVRVTSAFRPIATERRTSLSPYPTSFENNVANAGALEKIAHAKTGLSRTDDDDVFHVQTTVGSVQAKPSAHNKKNAKAH